MTSPASDVGETSQTDGQTLTEADFVIALPTNRCTACPAGHEPRRAHYDAFLGQHLVPMLPAFAGLVRSARGARSSVIRCWIISGLRQRNDA